MSRAVPWRSKCPPTVEARLAEVSRSSLFLVVQQPGPTSFVLKEMAGDSGRKFKVKVGETQECSCAESKSELCVHILFVMAKVFRVPASNPIIWQRGLLEAEVEQIVFGGLRENRRNAARAAAVAAEAAHRGSGEDGVAVDRKAIEEGDACPICCDDLDPAEGRAMVYCRFGCGNNIHIQCFEAYAKHNATNPTPLQCPLCRHKWGPLLQADPRPMLHNVPCSSCKLPIANERFRCAFCASFNLCRKCFDEPGVHAQHPFDVSSAPGQPFVNADRQQVARRGGSAPVGGAGGVGVDPLHVQLMHRELGPEDYESLLRLDDGVGPAAGSVLSMSDLARFRRVHWSSAEDYEECAICMESFVPDDNCLKLTTTCSHIFHTTCAVRWFTESRAVCPIDNIPVVVPRDLPPTSGGGQARAAGAATLGPSGVPTGTRRAAAVGPSGVGPPRRSASQQVPTHRFADVVHGRAPLARTGNVTEGSFRPAAGSLEGFGVMVTGLSSHPASAPAAPNPGRPVATMMLPAPFVPARVARLRGVAARR
jgi:E3 ubiquitin-protein ligase ZSWIM2